MYPRSNQEAEAPEPHTTAAANPSAANLWAAIPPDTDILVTHTPPSTHCDDTHGCEDLRNTLARVRPRLHVCGHVHQARGAERVRWVTGGLGAGDEAAVVAEASTEPWQDPSPDPTSAKISLVDLTARGGKRPLDFWDPVGRPADGAGAQVQGAGTPDPAGAAQRVLGGSRLPGPECLDGVGGSGYGATGVSEGSGRASEPGAELLESTGQRDRAGRRETCVVNCAIVATGWPHSGGKRFHKPIVVDIDLPVWR